MAPQVNIRDATVEDIPAVQEIAAYYVANTVLTFRHKVVPLEGMISTFHDITDRQRLPYLVGVVDQVIAGYAYASGFRTNMMGYAPTVEISLFCHPDYRSRGVGGKLLDALIGSLQGRKQRSCEAYHPTEAVELEITQALAVMALDEQEQGLKLRDWYIKKGFLEVGHLRQVGYKHGRFIDTFYLQRSL